MPCNSGYDEVRVIVKEIYLTEDEYKKRIDAEKEQEVGSAKREQNVAISKMEHAIKHVQKMTDERNLIVKELDEMTWAFCYITNKLFENDLEYLKLLLNNERVAKQFWEHQQLDMKANRSFIYKDKNGELKRFNNEIVHTNM